MRGHLAHLLTLLTAAACTRAVPPRVPKPVPKVLRTVVESPRPEESEYVVSDQAIGYGRLYLGGQGRALVNGVRVAPGEPFSTENPSNPLEGGRMLPSRFGVGFVFWNQEELFWASRFTGPLQPAGRLPIEREISRLTFGDDFALIHFAEGGRVAWSPKARRFIEPPEPGLIDIAVGNDGRGAALREPNQLWLRAAGSQTFNLWNEPTLAVERLDEKEGHVVVRTRLRGELLLGANGTLSPPPQDPLQMPDGQRLPSDPRYTLQITPRTRATQNGVLVGPDRAVIESNGAFALVDMRSGDLLEFVEPPVPGLGPCQLIPVPDDVLAVCDGDRGVRSFVIAGIRDLRPRVERRFESKATFYAGAPGTLVREGACEASTNLPERLSICVRKPSGEYKTITLHPRNTDKAGEPPPPTKKASDSQAASPPPAPPKVVRWVTVPDGDAVGVVLGEKPGLLHAAAGDFVEFTDSTNRSQWDQLRAPTALINADFEVLGNGHLRGITRYGTVDLAPSGQLSREPGLLILGKPDGQFLLARDSWMRVWQSMDHGLTWGSVRLPPGATRASVTNCSYAGCLLSDWYRIGYPSLPPEQWIGIDPPHAPFELPAPQTRLVCQAQGKAETRVLEFAVGNAEAPPNQVARMGARTVYVGQAALQSPEIAVNYANFGSPETEVVLASALIDFPSHDRETPLFRQGMVRRRSLQFHVPMTPAQLEEVGFTWRDVMRDLARQGSEVGPLDEGPGGHAIPVLAANGSRLDGLALVDQVSPPRFLIWVRPRQSPASFALPTARDLVQVLSVAARSDGTLVAAGVVDGEPEVFSVSPNAPALLAAPLPKEARPPRTDVVAVKDDGSLGLLRLWSSGPPTKGEPALVFTSEGAPVALAPWSTLVEGPCDDSAGYRAIIKVDGWIGLEVANRSYPLDQPAQALVHWNEERVCVAALEILHTMRYDEQVGDVLVSAQALFDAKPSAVRYRFGIGEEYREPLDCHLETR